MRPFEIVLLAALVPAVVGIFYAPARRPRWWWLLTALPALLGVVQLLAEGHRWQLVPAYTLAALLLVVALTSRFRAQTERPRSRARRALRVGVGVLGMLFLVVAAALPALFPVFRLPQPTGRFAVGFTRFALVDSAREEPFTADRADRRELLIWAWYPADAPKGRRATYWGPPGEITPRLATALGLPSFLFSHLALVRTNARVGAPIASAPALQPVLIFSHGYNQGFPGQNTAQMEELASHGYAVFSIAHPHESVVVAYPDGRITPVSKARMDSVAHGMRAIPGVMKKFVASRDRGERAVLFRQLISEPRLLHQSLRVWTDDTRFVIDELTRINTGGVKAEPANAVFAGKLDLARVGVFGMSFGGTTAGQVCVVEPRCKAGVNLDGLQYGDPIDVPLRVPFMFMYSAVPGLNDPVYERAVGPVYSVNVEGSTHFNYSDFSMISPIFKRIGFLGSIEGARMQAIMNAYLVAFFDTHLRGERAQLLDQTSAMYPEVSLATRVDVSR
ncbi:MAG: hypothetical protein M3373_14285 [Gemmatimonadota bacterium]|nr:hypothetical protein [Gemmatimonadota bacterium]